MTEVKAKRRVRIEGKDYVMADGDVVEFWFNVQLSFPSTSEQTANEKRESEFARICLV
jgi:hypothetical protein